MADSEAEVVPDDGRKHDTLTEAALSKYAKYCDGSIWKITNKDAKEHGLRDVYSLKSTIAIRAVRYGRGIAMRTLRDGIAIQVLSKQETRKRDARRRSMKAWNEFRRLQLQGDCSS